ncbi:MAG: lipopolysaccharide heptosyltransferase II [bacterium]|nr:lipopolysaccharide heptosyltransferase II [bacterium]
MDAPRRILVCAPNWLGDVLMATPALRALRRAHPDAEISISARANLVALIAALPGVDHTLPAAQKGWAAARAQASTLSAQGFDWAVLLPDSSTVALPPFLARIPLRAGYAREPLRRLLINRAVPLPRQAGKRLPISMIERYLRITRAIGCPDAGLSLDLEVHSKDREAIAKRLEAAQVDSRESLLVVTPGANFGASKLWPAEHFAEACTRLRTCHGLRAVLAPGPGEEPVARQIAELADGAALVLDEPCTSLLELAALIERATLVLSNDTGPRHMAVALATPVISLLGPTDPRHTEHLLEGQRILREAVDCSPCHQKTCPTDHRCMTRLAPARVEQAARELLS